MNRENAIEYIKRGLNPKFPMKKYRFFPFACLFFVLFGFYAQYYNPHFKVLSVIMLVVWLISLVVIVKLSFKNSTKNRMIVSTLSVLVMAFMFLSLLIISYYIVVGLDPILFLILLPSFIIPLLLCKRNSSKIKKDEFMYKKRIKMRDFLETGSFWGFVGGNFAAFALDFFGEREEAFILIASLVIVIYMLNAVSGLNLQRLYYLCKLERAGLVCEKDFEFCE